MKPTENLIQMIKKNEGFSPKITDDVGNPMIGYGCNLSVAEAQKYEGRTISEVEAVSLLLSRLTPVVDLVNNIVKVPLTQNQFDALCDLVYNIGSGGFSKSTLLKKLNTKDYTGAAEEFAKWNMAGGKVLSGLTKRREEEKKLFLS
jgi:lysozyme